MCIVFKGSKCSFKPCLPIGEVSLVCNVFSFISRTSIFYAYFILLSRSVSFYKEPLFFCRGWVEGLAWLVMTHDSIPFLCENWHSAKHLDSMKWYCYKNLNVSTLVCLARMERWFVNRCRVPLCPASIHLLLMEVVVPSVSVSIIFLQLGFCVCMDVKINNFNKNTTHVFCLCIIKIMKMAGPHGLSGPTAPPPVDVGGSKGADPAMASCHPALARRSKPAAA